MLKDPLRGHRAAGEPVQSAGDEMIHWQKIDTDPDSNHALRGLEMLYCTSDGSAPPLHGGCAARLPSGPLANA